MPKAFRFDVVIACICAIVLVASTFADWYLVRAIVPNAFAFSPKQDFMRVAVSPWMGEKALAAGLVILAVGTVAAMLLGESEKLGRPLAAAISVLAALTAVALFVGKLAAATSASVGMMTVSWSPLSAFYVAVGAAAALLVTSAVFLYRNTRPGQTLQSISIASSPSA